VAPRLFKLGVEAQCDAACKACGQLLEANKKLGQLKQGYQRLYKDHHNLIGELCMSSSLASEWRSPNCDYHLQCFMERWLSLLGKHKARLSVLMHNSQIKIKNMQIRASADYHFCCMVCCISICVHAMFFRLGLWVAHEDQCGKK
jgi:hypothetical protein